MKLILSAILLAGLAPQDPPKGGLGAWDTGKASATPLNVDSRAGWTELKDAGPAKGDLVVSNGRITAVFRRESGAVEMGRVQLRLPGATRLVKAAVSEVAKGSIAVDATYKVGSGEASAKFRVKKSDVTIEVSPLAGAAKLRVECPSRHVVLPDFFSDDMVIDAGKIPSPMSELPSENFLLHLAGKGEAIAMVVFQNRDQDVKVTLAGDGDKRVFTGSEIEFGKDAEKQKVWVALLEAPQIWHTTEVKPGDTKQARKLDWKMPWPAQWRVDFTRSDDLTDSWDLLLQKEEGGEYLKPSWMGAGAERVPTNRKRWTTVLGSFFYPCWSDPQGSAYLQPMEHRNLELRGPVVLYPANRTPETPLESFTVLDVARNSLGAGPCQYILDLDNQRSSNKGHATCWTRDYLTPIYTKGEQKSKTKEIDENLEQVLTFVKYIRSRITRYYDFLKGMHDYLGAQLKAHPELKVHIEALDKITQEATRRYTAREEKMKTPDYVAKMNDEFRKDLLNYEGPDAVAKLKAYTNALVEVGDNQDELAGELRWVVRAIRQKAGLVLAQEPKMAPIALEIRTKTQEILRSPAGHEGARH